MDHTTMLMNRHGDQHGVARPWYAGPSATPTPRTTAMFASSTRTGSVGTASTKHPARHLGSTT